VENDSIRASGNETLVDIWVEGKLRAICVTREAIEVAGGLDSADSEAARCEFVRTQLAQVVTAVKTKLRDGNAEADTIIIDRGQIDGAKDPRNDERRKGERRMLTRQPDKSAQGERRRTERRKKDRRRAAKKPS
jgi:hypothetical protein